MNAQSIRNEPPSDDAELDALLDRILPPIDETDPAWQAYVKAAVAEALANPRPSIPAEEAFAQLDARFAAYRAKHGL